MGDSLTHLAVDGKIAASIQNQALAALLVLYRVVLEKEFGWLEDVVRAKTPSPCTGGVYARRGVRCVGKPGRGELSRRHVA